MPRRTGELRRLVAEWNELVPIAQARGIRVRPVREFHLDRVVARQRVANLRAMLAPFYQPHQDSSISLDTFGIEMECYLPRGYDGWNGSRGAYTTLAGKIRDGGVMCQSEALNHTTRTHWKVTSDGSLTARNGWGHGAEVVSSVLSGENGFESIRKVCRTLLEQGAESKFKSCGLHVHVGFTRDAAFLKCLAMIYHHFDIVIDSFMAPSRRRDDNSYCSRVRVNLFDLERATTVADVLRAVSQDPRDGLRSGRRYRKLNLLPAMNPTNPTVEFRQHQGTTDPTKVEKWVRLCLRMVAKAATTTIDEILRVAQDFVSFMAFVGADEGETRYFNDRRLEFARRENRSLQ